MNIKKGYYWVEFPFSLNYFKQLEFNCYGVGRVWVQFIIYNCISCYELKNRRRISYPRRLVS